MQVFNVYSFRNPSDEIIVVKLNENGEVPFIKSPEGSSGFGYEPMQDSEPFNMLKMASPFHPARARTG